MIGKIQLNGFDHLNPDPTDEYYDSGKMFIEAMLSKDYSFVGETYFGLPNAETIINNIAKEGVS